MTFLRLALIITLAVGSTACFDSIKNLFTSPTSPSDTDDEIRSYLGTWSGPTAAPAAQSCASLQWKITSQNGSQLGGEFSAACADGVTLSGTLTATHSETTIPWAVTGTATKSAATCPFSITGTGAFQGTSTIVVNYAGTSCNGPVSGTETIKR